MKRSCLAFTLFVLCSSASTSFAQWTQTEGPETGNASVISVDAANAHVYVVANEGLFRSRDGGSTWLPLFFSSGLPGSFLAKTIAADNSVVFAAGGLGPNIAIFRSTDGGDSWSAAGIAGLPVLGLPIVFDIQGTTLLAGLEGNGVYRSTDNGTTWSSSSAGIAAGAGIGYFARQGADLYAATSLISPTKAVYRSTDGGSSWTATSFALAGFASINGLTANANGVFLSTNISGVYRTSNSGGAWGKINPDVTTNFATGLVATSANLFIGNGSRVYRANASGDTWGAVNTGLPAPNAGLSIVSIAASGTTILTGQGKLGIYRSTDAGENWVRSNTGLNAARINNGMLAVDSYLFAAADGAGFFRTDSNGDTWAGIDNGLDLNVGWYVFAKTGATLLGGTGSYKLYRSDDNGNSWTLSNAGLSLVGTFVFAVDEVTPSIVYAGGYSGMARSTDSGMSWTTLNSGIGGFQTVLCLWKDGPYMAYGANGSFKRSTDSGDTWTAPFTGLVPTASYGDFAQNGDTVYVCGTPGIFRSTDHGASWAATTAIAGGAQTLLAIGSDLFAGGISGVFHSHDGGESWTPISDGFPATTHIMDLAANDGYLFAGGLRSSIWRRPLSEVTPVLASLVSAEAGPHGVRVRWLVDANRQVVIERRTPKSAWAQLRTAAADGEGYVAIDDPAIEPGGRYGYRVGWKQGAQDFRTGEAWVEVPGHAQFAMHGARPNPAQGAPNVAFTLPRSGRVTIDVLDMGGRRVAHADEMDLAAGYHLVPMPSSRLRAAGVYTLRVTFAGVVKTAPFVLIR